MNGAKGDKGDAGSNGENGAKGDKGDAGSNGENGAKGDQGERGEKGVKGDTGASGIQGAKGDQGDRGPEGPQGAQGSQGVAGKKGVKGDPGVIAKKGEFKIPAMSDYSVGDKIRFNDECFGAVEAEVVSKMDGDESKGIRPSMKLCFNYFFQEKISQAVFIQAINRFTDSVNCKVNFSINLTENVTARTVCVNIVRTDSYEAWDEDFAFIFTMLTY